jgi:hypothetical protein
MQVAKSTSSPPRDASSRLRRRWTRQLLQTLIGICDRIEALQAAPEAKAACAEVRTQLRGLLGQQRKRVMRRRA